MEYKEIDPTNWKRKNQYALFKSYENPFFSITAKIDVSSLYLFAKKNKLSFNFCVLHCITGAINSVDELRCRIRGEKVRQYKTIHAGGTFLYDDETFGYYYAAYTTDIEQFCQACQQTITQLKISKILNPSTDDNDDLIHTSVLPWINFTSVKHPRRIPVTDSIPKIVYGKFAEESGKKFMPISLEAHHSLVDGVHAGRFFTNLQEIIDQL